MAKQPSKGRKPTAKTQQNSEKPKDSPESEPVVDVETIAEPATDIVEDVTESPVEPVEKAADAPDDSATQADPEPEVSNEPDTKAEEPAAPPPASVTTVVERGPGFVPLVIGGVVAGAIGYFLATLQYPDQGLTAADAARLAKLETQVADLPPPADLSGLTEQLTTVQSSVDALPAQIAALEDRVVVIERQPSADGTLQETALAAFEADLAALRDQISVQQAELQQMADAAVTRLDATRAEAQSIEQNAIDAARAATARAALANVQAALESGAPIGAALAELRDTMDAPVPEGLAAASDGVPTLASLQGAFPDTAREALAVARSEGVDGENSSGLGSLFKNTFEVRSVTPQEGDGVDAILSRAEAALGAGRLSDALAEVATLPEVSRGVFAAWTADAELRAGALDAASSLATSLNDN